MKTVGRLDQISRQSADAGSEDGHAFRDLAEAEVLKMTVIGVGAQFGGKYFATTRVICLLRHGASLPIGLGRAGRPPGIGKITDGALLEQLEINPAQYPDVDIFKLGGEVVKIDLRKPNRRSWRSHPGYPIKTWLSLTGPMIGRRFAQKFERLEQQGLPDYFKNHPVITRPADAEATRRAFGPTTAGRMDSFVADLVKAGVDGDAG